jgi:ubiquinone/menaquinone biosynthesis C-methylase UbiE
MEINYSKEELVLKINLIANKYNRLTIVENLFTHKFRKKLIRKAYGKILEISIGTGNNFSYYKAGCVISGIDLSSEMLKIAEQKSLGYDGEVNLSVMDAENTNFHDETFDTVVSTFSLCTCLDPKLVLKEMLRVCKKNGIILLLEHGQSSNSWIKQFQDGQEQKHCQPMGCHWNRNYFDLLKDIPAKSKTTVRFYWGIIYEIIIRK